MSEASYVISTLTRQTGCLARLTLCTGTFVQPCKEILLASCAGQAQHQANCICEALILCALLSRVFRQGSRKGQKAAGALVFTLRGEDPDNQSAPPRTYATVSPQLIWNPMRERSLPILATTCSLAIDQTVMGYSAYGQQYGYSAHTAVPNECSNTWRATLRCSSVGANLHPCL